MIIIHRDNLLNMLRSYKIMIDDTYYGKIKCGETKQINLEKGNHTIYLKIDRSEERRVGKECRL